ncbi:MAG: hypothetical protein U0793_30380 [Gemmataceae bacterium]
MNNSVLLQIELPRRWARLRFPTALQDRLQELLDRQDLKGKLTPKERREATALAEMAEMFSLIKLKSELQSRRKRP